MRFTFAAHLFESLQEMYFSLLTKLCFFSWIVIRTDVAHVQWGYGATAARLTPDQKVGSLNLSALMLCFLSAPAGTIFCFSPNTI